MRARKSKDPYKRLYDDMRALYVAGDQQGVVDLAIAEIDMFPAFDADELYHMPAYKASRLLLDDMQRPTALAGAEVMKASPKKVLAKLVLVFLRGDNYDQMNPYMRPEIKEAMAALGLHMGGFRGG